MRALIVMLIGHCAMLLRYNNNCVCAGQQNAAMQMATVGMK